MESRECCVHYPDKSIARDDNEPIQCCRSKRILLEKPKMFSSSTRKHAPGCPKFRRTFEEERQIGNVMVSFNFSLSHFVGIDGKSRELVLLAIVFQTSSTF